MDEAFRGKGICVEQDTVSWWWGIATVGGPILLGLAMAYAVFKTKPWKRRRDTRDKQGRDASREGYDHSR